MSRTCTERVVSRRRCRHRCSRQGTRHAGRTAASRVVQPFGRDGPDAAAQAGRVGRVGRDHAGGPPQHVASDGPRDVHPGPASSFVVPVGTEAGFIPATSEARRSSLLPELAGMKPASVSSVCEILDWVGTEMPLRRAVKRLGRRTWGPGEPSGQVMVRAVSVREFPADRLERTGVRYRPRRRTGREPGATVILWRQFDQWLEDRLGLA